MIPAMIFPMTNLCASIFILPSLCWIPNQRKELWCCLKDWEDTERMRETTSQKTKAAGIDCEIRTWNELSLGYSKMKSYLDTIFMFLSSIVLVIVVMTTINTMGMAIMERTKEIGTLRALGLKFKGVSILFALEGAFLGFFGSIVGIILHTCRVGYHKVYPLTLHASGIFRTRGNDG